MKKMTCLSAIACVSWLSCNNYPENPENKTTGVNPVVPGGNISDVNQQKQSQSNFGENFSPGIHYENSDPTYYPSNFTYVPTPDPKPNKSKVKELRDKISGTHYYNSDQKPSTSNVEELRDKIKNFKHVDNKNWFEFKQTIEDFERNERTKVSVKEATIQDDKLTFKILDVQGTIDLRLNEDLSQQGKFRNNIDAIQFLNDRGEKLEFPLNINTFPSKFSNSEAFGSNLDKIKKFYDTDHYKKFSVKSGVVQLGDENFLKLDSLNKFSALVDALRETSTRCFFDDSFLKNPITWKPNGKISFYGGVDCDIFVNDVWDLNGLLNDLDNMKKVNIKIDKIMIEQDDENIKLGGHPLAKDFWTNYRFWETLSKYYKLFDYGKGISFKEGNDGCITINNQPIKQGNEIITNVSPYKNYLIKHLILLREQANL